MKIAECGSNYVFVEDEGNAYCFSYGKLVAEITNGKYIEHQGEKFYSVTSNKHKSLFRKHYGVEVEK